MSGILYLVGTPIGNLGDISPRALETLEAVDFIAAEDTRVTVKILNHFNIKKPMISYYDHNIQEQGKRILSRLLNGEKCALVTDAGMPSISDPGQDLVNSCHEMGIKVASIPGPTAFATALSLSGMDSTRFTFEGFLSVSSKKRTERLNEIKDEKRTMIFYEAPHKLARTLLDMSKVLGDRKIAIVREMTKIYEEVIRTSLFEIVENIKEQEFKGEIVLIIEGKKEITTYSLDEACEIALTYMKDEDFNINMASKEASRLTGIKKGDIYRRLTLLDL